MKFTYTQGKFSEEKETNSSNLININSASAETLSELPGIGKTTAEKIVNFREKHSDFTNINEIMDIDGIGQKTFDSVKYYITVR